MIRGRTRMVGSGFGTNACVCMQLEALVLRMGCKRVRQHLLASSGAVAARWRLEAVRPHGSGLGRTRWVVERTLAWLHQFRRRNLRYDRRPCVHEAFLTLARLGVLELSQAGFCNVLLSLLNPRNPRNLRIIPCPRNLRIIPCPRNLRIIPDPRSLRMTPHPRHLQPLPRTQ